MSEMAPFRISIPVSIPATDRQSLITALETQAEVQIGERKDPTVDAILAIVKQAGDLAGAIVDIVSLATMIYGWARELHKRGMLPDITLYRPHQPELNLSRVQNPEEIEVWLRNVTR